jgi:hypothetical protein
MIVWLNGTFGAGKTTTGKELAELLPDSRLFDAEQVGSMLGHVSGLPPVRDFQDWAPWRPLVVETAARLLDYVGGTLITVQTVLVREYWTEISAGLAERGIPVRHFVLHADRDTLTARISGDTKSESANAGQWRLEHLPVYERALPWLREEGQVIDTTELAPERVARAVAAAVGG